MYNEEIGETSEDGMKKWMKDMIGPPIVYADEIVFRLTSLLMKRTIIFYPIFECDGHQGCGKIIYNPEFMEEYDPFHLLYFSETRFTDGHFQSIRPKE